ncbi:N-acetyl-gamma-glutamyl-phosphate reductase [Streptococcus mutans NN2025]|nr:N-acetyl-gamma-glutamyl-phosphate reductase [Streptococcus mutans NN2025]
MKLDALPFFLKNLADLNLQGFLIRSGL